MDGYGDEVQPIVIDCGSGMMKAGFAGDDAPRAVFSSIVGRPKTAAIMSGVDTSSPFVGDRAIRMKGILELSKPIVKGVIQNWDDLEKVWHHTFYSELRIDPVEHPMLIAEPPLNPKANRERLTQMMFETFEVPAVYCATAAVLAVYASGRNTAICLESGDGVTHTLPICEGYCMVHTIQRLNLGGEDVTAYLTKLLTERGYAFTSSSERDIVRDLKEKLCYVAIDFDAELQASSESSAFERSYELPDGNVVTIGSERFRAAEIMFQPSLVGKEAMSIVEMIHKTILGCDMDYRQTFYSNILLSGGNTMFEGIKDRIEKDMIARVPPTMMIKTVVPPERKYSVWIGGSILSSLSTFQSSWYSKEEYDDEGPEGIHERTMI